MPNWEDILLVMALTVLFALVGVPRRAHGQVDTATATETATRTPTSTGTITQTATVAITATPRGVWAVPPRTPLWLGKPG